MDNLEVENIWDRVRMGLLGELPESSYAWINSFEATGYAGGVFTVVTDLEMAAAVIRQFHLKEVKEVFKRVTGNTVDFEIICDKETVKAIRKDREKRGKYRITVYNSTEDE